MALYTCPQCKERSLTSKEKYRAGHWGVIRCRHCGARLCATPVVLALAYMAYFWVIAWFVGWALFERTWMPILYLIPVWLVVDYLGLKLMPISIMRKEKPQ